MASIQFKNGHPYVVYYFTDTNNRRRQKWLLCKTEDEALKQKKKIEYEQENDIFIPPTDQTVSQFMKEFVELYGSKNWSASTYSSKISLIKNYIDPYIGKKKLQDLKAFDIEKYYNELQSDSVLTKSKSHTFSKKITNSMICEIHKLLKTAFNTAVTWDLIPVNPFKKVKPPRHYPEKREIWSIEQIQFALQKCDDPILSLSIQLAFACSLRLGEILGLTWDNVHVSDDDIASNNAYIYIDRQLSEIQKDCITQIERDSIIKQFETEPENKTLLVLKKPKTRTSIRKIWLPKTLAILLKDWKCKQNEYRNYLGPDYYENNLVICFEDGRPCHENVIRRRFNTLIKYTGLPTVVFHSLRHSSTTYKLKLNNGDIKATQGDTGHAQADMVTDVYGHILDEDRRANAQKFDVCFYGADTDNKQSNKIDIDKLVNSLKEDPELLQKIANILNNAD